MPLLELRDYKFIKIETDKQEIGTVSFIFCRFQALNPCVAY